MHKKVKECFSSALKDIAFNPSCYNLSPHQLKSLPCSIPPSRSIPSLSLKVSLFKQRKQITKIIVPLLPNLAPKILFPLVKYPNQHIISHLLLLLNPNHRKSLLTLCACIEMINLATYLQESVCTPSNLSLQSPPINYILSKHVSLNKLIIIGDFFHTKASFLSSHLEHLSIPTGLSIIEEQLALFNICNTSSKDRLSQDDLYLQIFRHKAIQLALGLQMTHILKGQQNQPYLDNIFTIGVHLGYALHFLQLSHSNLIIQNKHVQQFQEVYNLFGPQNVKQKAYSLFNYHYQMAITLYPEEEGKKTFFDLFYKTAQLYPL